MVNIPFWVDFTYSNGRKKEIRVIEAIDHFVPHPCTKLILPDLDLGAWSQYRSFVNSEPRAQRVLVSMETICVDAPVILERVSVSIYFCVITK